jgi:CRP/FNR family transcriptional regulator, anaerobic regulatory protein
VSETKAESASVNYFGSPGGDPLTALGVRKAVHTLGKRADLAAGRQYLASKLLASPLYNVSSGEPLAPSSGSTALTIFQIRAGWVCQFHTLASGRKAIIDILLPYDIIGLDTALGVRPLQATLALTSVTASVLQGQNTLHDLMGCRHTALYINWLLALRQQRTDQLLMSISSLDARGRVSTMLLDIYTRLRRRKLITGSTYNLPLTQLQIGSYLGLTVVHINRVLRSLREERVAHVEKHCVSILDLHRLRVLAQRETVESAVTAPDVKHPSSATALTNSEVAA